MELFKSIANLLVRAFDFFTKPRQIRQEGQASNALSNEKEITGAISTLHGEAVRQRDISIDFEGNLIAYLSNGMVLTSRLSEMGFSPSIKSIELIQKDLLSERIHQSKAIGKAIWHAQKELKTVRLLHSKNPSPTIGYCAGVTVLPVCPRMNCSPYGEKCWREKLNHPERFLCAHWNFYAITVRKKQN